MRDNTTILAAYSGNSLSNLTLLQQDATLNTTKRSVTLAVTEGKTYRILCSPFYSSAVGSLTFTWTSDFTNGGSGESGTDPDPGTEPGTDPDPGEELDPGTDPGQGSSTGNYYVSVTGNDANAGTTTNAAFKTIDKAVSVATEGQKVVVLAGTHEISSEITVSKAITIVGEGWSQTIIKQTGTTRSFTLDKGAKLQGVTLTGANTTSAGAGALVKDGTISYCRICNNTSTPTDSAGAGVSFNYGKGQIDHCVLYGNTLGTSSKKNYWCGDRRRVEWQQSVDFG